MTITRTDRRVTYALDGASSGFAVPFPFLTAIDLQVTLTTPAGTEHPLALNIDYTVANSGAGGTVTYPAAGPAGGTLTIRRVVPRTQETDYVENDRFHAESHEAALDKLTMIAQEDADDLGRTLRLPDSDPLHGQMELPPLAERAGKQFVFDGAGRPAVADPVPPPIHIDLPPMPERAGKAFVFDAAGNPASAVLNDGDGNVRADLAAPTGALMVGLNGATLHDTLTSRRALPLAIGRKSVARKWFEALDMAHDLTEMIGPARGSGPTPLVTGGNGHNVYTVSNASDDVSIEGCLAWALNQARLNGGGMIVFVPQGRFTVRLRGTLHAYKNVTIAAPGRNVRLVAQTDLLMMTLRENNIILRWIEITRLPSISPYVGGPTYEQGGVRVMVHQADGIWIQGCTYSAHGDGALDFGSSALLPGSPLCRATVQQCLCRNQDKTMLIGATATSAAVAPPWAPTALDEAVRLNVLMAYNVFEGCSQRAPRAGALAFVHSLGNVHLMSKYIRDNADVAALYAGWAVTGGKLLSSGDLCLESGPVPALGYQSFYAHTDPWDPATRLGPGALRVEGTQVGPGVPAPVPAFAAMVPAPDYAYTVPSVPTDPDEQLEYAYQVYAQAGAAVNNGAEMHFTYVPAAEAATAGLIPDGYYVRAGEGGMFVASDGVVDAADMAPDMDETLRRGSTRTIDNGAITRQAGLKVYAVKPEAGTTDTLTHVHGLRDGERIYLRAASAGDSITVTSGGNIVVPAPFDLHAQYYVEFLMDGANNNLRIIGTPPA